jgi:hypothetical protein
MDNLTSKMDGVTAEEVLAEAELALAPELAQARGVKLVPGSASTAAVGEIV